MANAPALDCPTCGEQIVKSYGREAKMRSKLIKWDHKGMFAVCKSCGSDVEVTSDLLKSIESSFVFEVGVDKKSS